MEHDLPVATKNIFILIHSEHKNIILNLQPLFEKIQLNSHLLVYFTTIREFKTPCYNQYHSMPDLKLVAFTGKFHCLESIMVMSDRDKLCIKNFEMRM